MRLLQLSTSPDEVLDLHPNVSIVTGLDAVRRGLLIDAVARLARAEAAAGPGLLEAHGVLFDLDPELLNLIEAAADDIDPIVRVGQLPTQPVSLDARELRSREDAFGVLLELIGAQADKQSMARSTLASATTALERAHEARAEAVSGGQRRGEAIEQQARRLEDLADTRRQTRRQLEETRHELQEARRGQDDVAERTTAISEAHRAAIALRERIEAELDALEAPAVTTIEPIVLEPAVPEQAQSEPGRSGPVSIVDEERIQELEQLLVALVPVERMLLERALAAMSSSNGGESQISPEAMQLADELDRIDDELAAWGPDAHGTDQLSVADARSRLDDARQTLLEAEQAVRSPELDRDDILRLEDLHGELIDAIDKTDGRFGKARAGARVVELRVAEQEVLDRLGFSSYSAYMMGYSLNHTDPAKETALDAARAGLAEAEDAWALLKGASEDELEHAAALDRRRALLQDAERLLARDVSGAPQADLRALRRVAAPKQDSASVLRAALDALGIDLADEELDHEELVVIGEAWLAEADVVEARRSAAINELAVARGDEPVAAPHAPPEEPGPSFLDPVPWSEEPDLRGSELRRDLATARDMERSAADTVAGADGEIAAAADKVAKLEGVEAQLVEKLSAVDVDVAEVDAALAGLHEDVDLSELDMQLESAKAVHSEAQAAMEVIDQAMATLDAEGRAEAQEIERLQDIVAAQGTGTATPAEELEWYLLARLAAQRAVSIAGSTPLLLDDALSGLGIEEACHLLTRLERMADVVQVIVVSDDPVVATWAMTTGPARAAVVSVGAR